MQERGRRKKSGRVKMMESKYITWLRRKGVPLFEGAGTCWTTYQGALIPASPMPGFYELGPEECRALLEKSGAWFVRYSSVPCDYETSWWYVVCDNYDPVQLSAKTRQNVKRGKRECSVREVDAEWLADHGYPCYTAAFGRYQDGRHVSESDFREGILDTRDGPFAYWAVFYGDRLAGYCQCILDGKQAATNITKYHPEFLRHRTAYALIDMLIQTYVAGQNMVLSNGNRSIAHNTNYQEVLIGLGFRKQYCRLNIVYNPLLKLGIEALYPVRSLISRMSDRHIVHKVRALLYQEEIRRRGDL